MAFKEVVERPVDVIRQEILKLVSLVVTLFISSKVGMSTTQGSVPVVVKDIGMLGFSLVEVGEQQTN